MRDTLDANSRHWTLLIDQRQNEAGTQRLCRYRRTSTGGGNWNGEGNDLIPCTNVEPNFQDVTLQINKSGDTFTGSLFYSDGQTLTVGSDGVSLGSTFYVGIMVAAAEGDILEANSFSINNIHHSVSDITLWTDSQFYFSWADETDRSGSLSGACSIPPQHQTCSPVLPG